MKPEGPCLFVFNTCRQFIRTVHVLPRDEIDMGDGDTAAEDHMGDETRYRLLSKEQAAAASQICPGTGGQSDERGRGTAVTIAHPGTKRPSRHSGC